mmetsp:Transcript_35373/g.92006  ORF Transcript_35373/g.92006 Transcript_35373/m.92006 type:complete len:223 (-) Transcript_35373:535-1203(-)
MKIVELPIVIQNMGHIVGEKLFSPCPFVNPNHSYTHGPRCVPDCNSQVRVKGVGIPPFFHTPNHFLEMAHDILWDTPLEKQLEKRINVGLRLFQDSNFFPSIGFLLVLSRELVNILFPPHHQPFQVNVADIMHIAGSISAQNTGFKKRNDVLDEVDPNCSPFQGSSFCTSLDSDTSMKVCFRLDRAPFAFLVVFFILSPHTGAVVISAFVKYVSVSFRLALS